MVFRTMIYDRNLFDFTCALHDRVNLYIFESYNIFY